MAIVFPRATPSAGVVKETFEIERVDYLSPEAGGNLGSISAGFPRWYAEWDLPTVGQARADEWRAWVSGQRGSGRLFLGCEQARPYPLACPPTGFAGMVRAGGGVFDGRAITWAVNGTRDVLTLTGLPAGFSLTWGDYCGFEWTTSGQPRRALARSIERATANGAGTVAVTIEPPLWSQVPADAVANLDRPNCLMKLVPSETQLGGKTRQTAITGRIKALQQLKP